MRCIVNDDYDELSRVGADLVEDLITAKPTAAVLVATGDTPMGLYQELARRRANTTFDPSRVQVFQLDEYLGLEPGDRRSLFGWTKRSFVDPLGIDLSNVTRLAADASDLDAACRDYDATISSAGGLDLAILGLGPNGHLGFNEPPADEHARTRVVDLTPESIESNARYWGRRDAVPRRAITAGMDVILAARHILLLVSGSHKSAVLASTVAGSVTPMVPASYLQLARDVTVLADRDAWSTEPQIRRGP